MEVIPSPPFEPKEFEEELLPIAWIILILSSPLVQWSILKFCDCQNTFSSQVLSNLPKWDTVLLQLCSHGALNVFFNIWWG